MNTLNRPVKTACTCIFVLWNIKCILSCRSRELLQWTKLWTTEQMIVALIIITVSLIVFQLLSISLVVYYI